jgi:hypothetical protein
MVRESDLRQFAHAGDVHDEQDRFHKRNKNQNGIEQLAMEKRSGDLSIVVLRH